METSELLKASSNMKNIKIKNNRFKLSKLKNRFTNILKKKNKEIKVDKSKKSMKKLRDPGIELVRIFAMYAIIINHIISHGNIFAKYPRYGYIFNFILILCKWHVCSFGLISGIVGYKSNKYSNLLNLWLSVFFYSISIPFIIKKYKTKIIIKRPPLYDFFPVIYNNNWYFSKYFGMYLFLPVINRGIEYLSKTEFRLLVISTIGIFNIYSYIMLTKKDTFLTNNGFSVISLLIFYIAGAYIGKYKIKFFGIKKILLYLICIFLYIFSSLLTRKMIFYNIGTVKGLFFPIIFILKRIFVVELDSVPMILQAISIIFFLTNINYNEYIAKIINFLGPLTFGVYLIHENIIVINNITVKIFDNDPNNLPLKAIYKLLFFKCFKVYCICFFIEYLRNLLFTICRIKKICILIEKKIYELF